MERLKQLQGIAESGQQGTVDNFPVDHGDAKLCIQVIGTLNREQQRMVLAHHVWDIIPFCQMAVADDYVTV